MRQILYGEQWIHPEEPQIIRDIFYKYGKEQHLKKGTELMHGGPCGEVTLLVKGLGLYLFTDSNMKEHVMSLIIPNRVMGDIDGACCNVANVCVPLVMDSTVLTLSYEAWHREVFENNEVLKVFTNNVVRKQESHIEALLACFTLDVADRLRSFFQALIKSYYPVNYDDWNPVPVIGLNTVLLAKIVSASRTSVSLTLTEWTNKGLIRKDGSQFVIHGHLLKGLNDWFAKKDDII